MYARAREGQIHGSRLVLDGGAPNYSISSCNNITLPALGDGGHNVTVYANDSVGTTNSTIVIFTIDTTPLVVDIINPTNSTYSTTTVPLDFTFNETNLGSCWYVLDSNAPVFGCSNASLSSLSQGSHNVTVYVNDTAGNMGSDTVWFSVDSIAPIVTIINPQNQTYNISTLNLNFTVSETATCWFVLDGGAPNYSISKASRGRRLTYLLRPICPPAALLTAVLPSQWPQWSRGRKTRCRCRCVPAARRRTVRGNRPVSRRCPPGKVLWMKHAAPNRTTRAMPTHQASRRTNRRRKEARHEQVS